MNKMGIPSYFSYIIKNHPEIVRKYLDEKSLSVQNFYLDCNSIIYDCYAKLDPSILTEESGSAIICAVILKIEEYISLVQPTHNIIIAFDGVAPIAKLKQQRERRYKSWYQSEVIKNIKEQSQAQSHKEIQNTSGWDKTAITPGTIFMNELNSRISAHFCTTNTPTIIVSGSNSVGEGEHKIFQYIRNHPEKHTSDTNTFIYGLDSDLIMLGINHLYCCPNIFLFRETPDFIQNISSDLNPNENFYLDIRELSHHISQYMSSNNELNRMHDYILLCFLLGNDFLPHFPALNIRTGGIDKLLSAYKISIGDTNLLLTDGTTIHWNNFKKLIKVLADLEEEYIIQEYKIRYRMETKQQYLNSLTYETNEEQIKADIEYFNCTPLNKRTIENKINPFNRGWQNRYYKYLFTNENQPVYDKRSIAVNYLEGLEWTMKYYTTGNIDWKWKYKYNYPPLLEDLYLRIPSKPTNFITNINSCEMPEIAQLCYVLPRYNFHLIPQPLAEALMNEFPDWYADQNFVWTYCRYFWESHLEMNDLNIDKFVEIVKKHYIC